MILPSSIRRPSRSLVLWSLLTLALPQTEAASAPAIRLTRAPASGIQPQAALDTSDRLHLVYYSGPEAAGNLDYVTRNAGSDSWSSPIRINSRPGAAIAVGTIRGPQLALGRGGRPHITWVSSQTWPGPRARTQGPPPGHTTLYTRLAKTGDHFEPERDLMTRTAGLDGGGSVAADDHGNVFVVWHGFDAALTRDHDERDRAIYAAISKDDGTRFDREVRLSSPSTGTCACCGLKAAASTSGHLMVLYRQMNPAGGRDEVLLQREPSGGVRQTLIGPWSGTTCPMSSADLTFIGNHLWLTWEQGDSVKAASLTLDQPTPSPVLQPGGETTRKHPVVTANSKGEILMAWTEGTGWNRGGRLAWQTFNAKGLPTSPIESKDGVAVWSLVAAVAHPDGTFEIVY